MPSQPESKLVSKIRSSLQTKYNVQVLKIHGGPYQQNGISDLLCNVNGIFLALEVKVPGKKNTLTKLQQRFLDTVTEHGGYAHVVDSVEEAEGFVEVILDETLSN